MKVITFTRSNRKIPSISLRPGLEFQHVTFESSNLDDLLLIAAHKIVDFPTSLVVDGRGKVLLKVRGAIPRYYLNSLTV